MGEGSAARWWLDLKADRSWCVQRLTSNAVLKLDLKMKFCNVRDLKMTAASPISRGSTQQTQAGPPGLLRHWPGAAAALRAPPPGAMPQPPPFSLSGVCFLLVVGAPLGRVSSGHGPTVKTGRSQSDSELKENQYPSKCKF